MKPTTLVFILFFKLMNGQVDSIKYITIGHFAGECIGYCQSEEKYDSTSLTVTGWIISDESNTRRNYWDSIFISGHVDSIGNAIVTHPTSETTVIKSKLKKGEWGKFVHAFDMKSFYLMLGRIGCPDCTDGGGMWIEITCTNSFHRVTFDPYLHSAETDKLLSIAKLK